ncbi:HK97-gp10 family putative phage morphogenesis protein [Solibacillus sp. FSL H8-0538]|uniref:HK97-gp10 family putative phage morphogenesis protein n=1 Tax=Solibacillus sp. FSL H8-0538 TaxID=2921400 RepID=UPI0030F7774C
MEINFSGLDAVMQNIARMAIEEDTERKALIKAAKVVKDAISEEAPVDKRSGEDSATLKNNIKSSRPVDGEVKIHTGQAYHAHLVEFGRSAGSAVAKKKGKEQKVTWGATAANPFFTRGFEGSKDTAMLEMAEVIKRDLKL